MTDRIEFAIQLDAGLVEALRNLAQAERRPFQTVREETLTGLLATRRALQPRLPMTAHDDASVRSFGPLDQRLAR